MKLRKLNTALALAALGALALPNPAAWAADTRSPSDRPFSKRLYLGAGVGASELDPDTTTSALSVTDDRGRSATLTLGYDISPRLSVDAYAGTLGEAEIAFLGDPVGAIDYTVYGVSLLGYLHNFGSPYTDDYRDDGLYQREGLSTYVRLGVGGMSNDSDRVDYHRDHTLHLATGLGLEYGWSNGMAMRAELSAYDSDARQLSLSLLKRFGDPGYALAAPAVTPAVTQPVAPIAPLPDAVDAVLDRPLVLFAFDRDEVKPEYRFQLNQLAEALIAHPGTRVRIDGHTDWVGGGAYNMALSKRRANSVKTYLIDRGVDPARLIAVGHGEHQPVADNTSAEGRAKNRRVEISRAE